MPRFRFSLLGLLGMIAVVAMACAALASPNKFWLAIISAFTLGLLFFAVIATVYGRNASRAFWLGFAVVGWGYSALEWIKISPLLILPTKFASKVLMSQIHPAFDPVTRANLENVQSFEYTMLWLWSLLLGYVGGLVAGHLYLRLEGRSPK